MAFYEYQVTYLSPGEPDASWEQTADLYSGVLSTIASEGWEVSQWSLPWVVWRRGLTDGAGDQAAPVIPQGDIPLGDVARS